MFELLDDRGGGQEHSAGPPQQGSQPRQQMAGREDELYDAASPKQRKEILGKKMLPIIQIMEPELATTIMNYLMQHRPEQHGEGAQRAGEKGMGPYEQGIGALSE